MRAVGVVLVLLAACGGGHPAPDVPNVDRAGFAEGLRQRLIGIFRLSPEGTRPVLGPVGADATEADVAVPDESALLQSDPRWRDRPWFFEYFHGDTAKGLGAAHQTGWTALIASLIRNPPSGFPGR